MADVVDELGVCEFLRLAWNHLVGEQGATVITIDKDGKEVARAVGETEAKYIAGFLRRMN